MHWFWIYTYQRSQAGILNYQWPFVKISAKSSRGHTGPRSDINWLGGSLDANFASQQRLKWHHNLPSRISILFRSFCRSFVCSVSGTWPWARFGVCHTWYSMLPCLSIISLQTNTSISLPLQDGRKHWICYSYVWQVLICYRLLWRRRKSVWISHSRYISYTCGSVLVIRLSRQLGNGGCVTSSVLW